MIKLICIFLLTTFIISLFPGQVSADPSQEEENDSEAEVYQASVIAKLGNSIRTRPQKSLKLDEVRKRIERIGAASRQLVASQALRLEESLKFVERAVDGELVPLSHEIEKSNDISVIEQKRKQALYVLELVILQSFYTEVSEDENEEISSKIDKKFFKAGAAASAMTGLSVGIGHLLLSSPTIGSLSVFYGTLGAAIPGIVTSMINEFKGQKMFVRELRKAEVELAIQVLKHFDEYARKQGISLKDDFGFSLQSVISEFSQMRWNWQHVENVCTRYLTEHKVEEGPRVETYRQQLRVGAQENELANIAAAQEFEDSAQAKKRKK